MKVPEQYSGARFSSCHTYRYALWRRWNFSKPMVLFICLNPSRANHKYNDPTITRCIDFAKRWGYGGMWFGNLFAIRSPYPQHVVDNLDKAIGPYNDYWLEKMASESKLIVFGWGSWKFTKDRADQMINKFPEAQCLGINKDGSPKHPLYIRKDEPLKPYLLKRRV